MEFKLKAESEITMVHDDGDTTSSLKACHIKFSHGNLSPDNFIDGDTLTMNGTKSATCCFIQGLIVLVKNAHEDKVWDEADHFRYIISELERAFCSTDIELEKDQ